MATANATVKAVLDYLNEKSSQSVPTGMVAYFGLNAVPSGWLLCNGSNVSRTTYANLFKAIGTRFGAGDGSTTFTLPNLNERFIEGTTSTSKVGTKLEAGLPNITGQVADFNDRNIGITPTVAFYESGTRSATPGEWGSGYATRHYISLDASRAIDVYGNASTVQPASVQLLPCIKT